MIGFTTFCYFACRIQTFMIPLGDEGNPFPGMDTPLACVSLIAANHSAKPHGRPKCIKMQDDTLLKSRNRY